MLTNDNKEFLPSFLDQTDKWPIDFHEIILLRDVPDEQQLKLKDTYKKLSERQQRKSSSNWRKSFNGKIFEKLYKETLKRLDKDKKHSSCVAGTRFVEVFPDGLVRGCEVEKLWEISTIGKVEKHFDIVNVLNSKKLKNFQKLQKIVAVPLNVLMQLVQFMTKKIGHHYYELKSNDIKNFQVMILMHPIYLC